MVKAAKQVHSNHNPTQVELDATSNTSNTLKYESIRDLQNRFSLNKAEVKELFGISESTQFRYEKHNRVLKPAIADRLERFNRICQQARELFEEENETQRWLTTPKSALLRRDTFEGDRY